MNLTELLKFLPLIIGVFLAYHLIVRQSLPSKKLGEMLTYFIGIIIVFIVISWLITSFLAGWATDLLQAGTTSTEWQEFMSESENVVDDAFNAGGGGTPGQPTAQPTAVQVFPTLLQAIPTAVQATPTAVQVVPTAVQVLPTAVHHRHGSLGNGIIMA